MARFLVSENRRLTRKIGSTKWTFDTRFLALQNHPPSPIPKPPNEGRALAPPPLPLCHAWMYLSHHLISCLPVTIYPACLCRAARRSAQPAIPPASDRDHGWAGSAIPDTAAPAFRCRAQTLTLDAASYLSRHRGRGLASINSTGQTEWRRSYGGN